MTNGAFISLTYGQGRPIEELQKLIAARVKQLGESTSDATVAVAIDAMNALRARTLVANDRTARGGISVKEITADVRWRGRGHLYYGGREITNEVVWVHGSVGSRDSKFFRVVPVHERQRPYIVACLSREFAVQKEVYRAKKRVKRFSKLARFVLGVGMAKLSTRNNPDNKHYRTKIEASKLAVVDRHEQGFGSGRLDLYFRSDVDYSLLALKGGRASVAEALKSAANKIAGIITRHVTRTGFGQRYETPFPEVRRNR